MNIKRTMKAALPVLALLLVALALWSLLGYAMEHHFQKKSGKQDAHSWTNAPVPEALTVTNLTVTRTPIYDTKAEIAQLEAANRKMEIELHYLAGFNQGRDHYIRLRAGAFTNLEHALLDAWVTRSNYVRQEFRP